MQAGGQGRMQAGGQGCMFAETFARESGRCCSECEGASTRKASMRGGECEGTSTRRSAHEEGAGLLRRPFLVFEGLSKTAYCFDGEISGRGALLIRHYVAVRKRRELFCEVISHYEEARLVPFGTFLPRKLPNACWQRGGRSGGGRFA